LFEKPITFTEKPVILIFNFKTISLKIGTAIFSLRRVVMKPLGINCMAVEEIEYELKLEVVFRIDR